MAYDDYQRLRIVVRDGICRATVDNPPINLLDADLIPELARFAQQVGSDDAVRVVVVDSADPDFFMAHADVTLIQQVPTGDTGNASGCCRRADFDRFASAMASSSLFVAAIPSTAPIPLRHARRGLPTGVVEEIAPFAAGGRLGWPFEGGTNVLFTIRRAGAVQLHLSLDALEVPRTRERPGEDGSGTDCITGGLGNQHRAGPRHRRHPAGYVWEND